MLDWNIAVIALAGRYQRYDHCSMFNMAASCHLGFCRKWNMTTAKVAADLYVLVYQIWLRRYVKVGRVMAILKWRTAAILDFHRSEIWRYFCFQDVGFSLWAKFCVNMCNSDWVMAILNFVEAKFLTSGAVAADPCLSPYQIWIPWRAAELWRSMCF